MGLLFLASCAWAPPLAGVELRLRAPHFTSPNNLRFQATADHDLSVRLETSTDLTHWTSLGSHPLRAGTNDLTASHATAILGFYRLREERVCPDGFADWSAPTNSARLIGDGWNTVQVRPDGRPAFLYWDADVREARFRHQLEGGCWETETVDRHGTATLLLDGQGRFHILDAVHHYRRDDRGWEIIEPFYLPDIPGLEIFGVTELIGAAFDPRGTLHVLIQAEYETEEDLETAFFYANNRSGWSVPEPVATVASPWSFYGQSYAPRFQAFAVDPDGFAHAVYTPEFFDEAMSGGGVRSELHYASSRSGRWVSEKVFGPGGSGDAGLGASIAIAPDGTPTIANWYVIRADTGSPRSSSLRLHERRAGVWQTTTVLSAPDGYQAGDGKMGTGFAPYVRFDDAGRLHLVFTDHASQHFPGSGADEFGGCLRHAVREAGRWTFRTLFLQTDPIRNQFVKPSFAVGGGRLFVLGEQRRDTLGPAPEYRIERSDYVLRWLVR